MTHPKRTLLATLALSLLVHGSRELRAEDPKCESLEAWMPNDVIAAMRVDALSARIDTLLSSQLRKDSETAEMAPMPMVVTPLEMPKEQPVLGVR